MSSDRQESFRLVLQTLSTAGIMGLLAVNGWALTKIVAHDASLAVVEAKVSTFMDSGERYTRGDAESDLGHVIEKANDHELRIRTLEKE